MSRKILTFEEYVQETDRSEEIEKEITDLGEVEDLEDEVEDSEEEVEVDEADRAEEIEDEITDLGEPEDLEDEVIDNDGVPVAEADRSEEIEDEINDLGDVEDLEDEVEDSEEEVEVDEESEEEKAEIVEKMVSEMLSEIYGESCKNEAMNYESDDYEDHTIESYMKENAALVAALSTESMREAHTESTEENMKLETFEAVCESMKESYCKKIDEMKESFNVGNVERKGLGGGGM